MVTPGTKVRGGGAFFFKTPPPAKPPPHPEVPMPGLNAGAKGGGRSKTGQKRGVKFLVEGNQQMLHSNRVPPTRNPALSVCP